MEGIEEGGTDGGTWSEEVEVCVTGGVGVLVSEGECWSGRVVVADLERVERSGTESIWRVLRRFGIRSSASFVPLSLTSLRLLLDDEPPRVWAELATLAFSRPVSIFLSSSVP